MNDPGQLLPLSDPATRIAAFLNGFIAASGLDLRFHMAELASPASPSEIRHAFLTTATFTVEFTGSDTPVLIARNGEVLHALEYTGARILRLESDQNELLCFNADSFKENRARELQKAVDIAIQSVRTTGRPYAFAPMSSRERRMLHLALAPSGLPTSSSGENPRRYVILYPEGYNVAEQTPSATPAGPSSADRTRAIRNSFRRR